jgi:hypothetical protein
MIKKFCFFTLMLFTFLVHSLDYSNTEGIHTTLVTSSWCGNLAVSTRVGYTSENGGCIYVKETPATAYDFCGPFHLNAYFLEKNAGLGFDCAATLVHSNVMGQEGLDEYLLIKDAQGHYVDSSKHVGEVHLK